MVVVEIGNDWLKILHARADRRGLIAEHLFLERIVPGDLELPGRIAALFEKHRLPKNNVVACLPRQVVNVRLLDLPSTDRDEIADMVELQSARQTPYTKDEIVFDYRVLSTAREGYTKVMLAIVQRNVLRERFLLLEEAGLSPVRMTVTSEGLLNWFNLCAAVPADQGAAILDVDSFYSDFAVIAARQLVFTRSMLMGANELIGGDPAALQRLVGEVKRSLDMFRSEHGRAEMGKLIVTGAGLHVTALAGALRAALDLPVENADVRGNMTRQPKGAVLDDPANLSASLTSIVGMALAPQELSFNLVPETVRFRRNLLERARRMSWLTILVMGFMLSLSTYACVRYGLAWSALRTRQHGIAATEKQAQAVRWMQGIVKVIRERERNEASVLRQLDVIHAATPRGIYLDQLDLDVSKRQATMEGAGQSIKEIRDFAASLENGPFFKNVKDGGYQLDPAKGMYKFRMVCALEVPE